MVKKKRSYFIENLIVYLVLVLLSIIVSVFIIGCSEVPNKQVPLQLKKGTILEDYITTDKKIG